MEKDAIFVTLALSFSKPFQTGELVGFFSYMAETRSLIGLECSRIAGYGS